MARVAGWMMCVVVGLTLAACSEPAPSSGPTTFDTTTLDRVHGVTQAPAPRFSRTMFAAVKLGPSPMMLDLCRGPVAIDLGRTRPVLVAEHDYCGGTQWIPKLREGDAVTLKGDGVEPGTYIVTGLQTERRGAVTVKDLPAADVVLQTCISPSELVLVATTRFVPTMTS